MDMIIKILFSNLLSVEKFTIHLRFNFVILITHMKMELFIVINVIIFLLEI
jgi:hypothetical protein